jgi:hypothetical protein
MRTVERWIRASLAVVAAIAVISAVSLVSGLLATASADAAGTAPLNPSSGAYFGAAVPDVAGVTNQQEVLNYEGALGRKLDFERVYKRWDDSIVDNTMRWDRDNNRNVIVSVNSVTGNGATVRWSDIASGRYDALIRQQADALKAFGAPIWVAFNHEPEDDTAAGGPADFVAAWRHYVDVVRAQGATNVAWTWIMMAYSFRAGSGLRAPSYYPGDDYTDFVAADGYNWYDCDGRNASWSSFQSIFTDFHTFGVVHGKPEIIAEYGSSEDPAAPGRKAQWVRDVAPTLAAWPEIKAVSYWGPSSCFDINSSSSSLQALADLGAGSYLRLRPAAALAADRATGAAPLTVTFTGAGSSSARGSLAGWSFDPGDGTATVTGTGNPPASIPHVYLANSTSPASYTATLTVQDVNGQSDWQTQVVTASPAPVVTTSAGTTAGVTTADVGGRVDPNGLPTSYYVQYGTTTAYGARTAAGVLPAGDRAVAVPLTLAGLTPVTTYHYRLVADNAAGTTYGDDRTFSTQGPATAVAYGAGMFVAGGVTVRGAVDPNGIATRYRVEFGTSASYGTTTTWTDAGEAKYQNSVSIPLARLAPSTTYHYQIVATNSAGTGRSEDQTFTSAGAPSVRTDGAASITANSAVGNGWVDSNQLATTYNLQYGVTASYGMATASSVTSVPWGARVPGTPISRLGSRTLYHYRIVASNVAGRTYGTDRTFTTK